MISVLSLNWEFSITDTIIDGIIVGAIWAILAHYDGKKEKEHLEEQLDELYEKIEKLRQENDEQQ